MYFNFSLDDGVTWLDQEIEIGNQIEGWALDIPGIYRCNGMPVTICDISDSPYKGTIYVNWADQRNGKTNTDIWLKKSSDGGKTWSNDIRVNSDNSKRHQFLTWMTIDQSTGYLYVVYYDRRAHDDNQTDVYLSVSKDGGESFKDYKISEHSFLPNPEMFCKLKTLPKFVMSCASNVKFACVGSFTRVLTPFVTTACISGYPTPK